MKHGFVTASVCLAIAAGFAFTTTLTGQESQAAKYKEVSLTGCVVQGTGPDVFIFENAKADPRGDDEKGRNYLLASGSMSISFREHLNTEVRIDGTAEMKMPPDEASEQSVKESDLPKLKATKIVHVATTCSPPHD